MVIESLIRNIKRTFSEELRGIHIDEFYVTNKINVPLYRGSRYLDHNKLYFIESPMNKVDTTVDIKKFYLFEEILKKENFQARPSNSIFISPSKDLAKFYGDYNSVFYAFPYGQVYYTFSSYVDDYQNIFTYMKINDVILLLPNIHKFILNFLDNLKKYKKEDLVFFTRNLFNTEYVNVSIDNFLILLYTQSMIYGKDLPKSLYYQGWAFFRKIIEENKLNDVQKFFEIEIDSSIIDLQNTNIIIEKYEYYNTKNISLINNLSGHEIMIRGKMVLVPINYNKYKK